MIESFMTLRQDYNASSGQRLGALDQFGGLCATGSFISVFDEKDSGAAPTGPPSCLLTDQAWLWDVQCGQPLPHSVRVSGRVPSSWARVERRCTRAGQAPIGGLQQRAARSAAGADTHHVGTAGAAGPLQTRPALGSSGLAAAEAVGVRIRSQGRVLGKDRDVLAR